MLFYIAMQYLTIYLVWPDNLVQRVSILIYWATKETPSGYIPILFETKISEHVFLNKYEHYNV